MKTLVLLLWLACLSQADIKCDLKSGTVDSAYNKVGDAALKGIKFHDDRNKGNMRLFECTCDDDDVRNTYLQLHTMAIPVVEFSREGYKIRKVFG